jgi:TPR repeat protein
VTIRSIAVASLALLALSACAVGVKRTPGMNLYAGGDHAAAIPLLEQEVAAGEVSARYSLGLAYRDGTGVTANPAKAEILLTGAAIGGDPRAVEEIRRMLDTAPLCPLDRELHGLWGGVGLMNRNLITGVVELNTAPPPSLVRMAEIYDAPCAGRPVQVQAAKSLRSLAGGPRHIWIYITGMWYTARPQPRLRAWG